MRNMSTCCKWCHEIENGYARSYIPFFHSTNWMILSLIYPANISFTVNAFRNGLRGLRLARNAGLAL